MLGPAPNETAMPWIRYESFPPTHIPHFRATRAYTLAM
jgi:hypothetical protein